MTRHRFLSTRMNYFTSTDTSRQTPPFGARHGRFVPGDKNSPSIKERDDKSSHSKTCLRRLCILLPLTFGLSALLLGSARGQETVVPLPAIGSATSEVPARMVSHPDSTSELPQPIYQAPQFNPQGTTGPYQALPQSSVPNESLPEPCFADGSCVLPEMKERNPDLPPDARDGMFQKLIFTSAYLDGGGSQGLGVTEMDLRAVLALPIPSRKAPMLITPGFGTYFLDWSGSPDLPSQLYDSYVQFRWMYRWNPSLATDFAITPGVYSDFQQGSDEAIRLPGHGAVLWTWNPEWKVLLGCAYTDRLENNILPIGGLIWTPNEDVNYEMVFPKPKLAQRIRWFGACTQEDQDWLYLAGEFGGSTWAIRRADDTTARMDYCDWRILLGLEHKAIGRLDYRFELGYVFSRRFLYDTSPIEYEPDDTFMVRMGATY